MKKYLVALFLLCVTGFASISCAEEVQTSTATGDVITYDNQTGEAVIEGNAVVITSTAVLKADKITVNTQTKQGHLEGNVSVEQASGTITGSEIFYDWNASTGLIYGAEGVSPPWRFTADKMIQAGEGHYLLYQGYLTSCDATPPHYIIRSSKADVITGKRATMKNSRFVLDEISVFWSPHYSRSLIPKKYSLRIEPGSSGRDGLIAKTVFGYPFTPNTYTNLKWDYFQKTGNGFGFDHSYYLPKIRGNLNSYYIRDTNPDPQPQSRRFDLNWNHYESFTSRLSANAKVNFKSDQNFGNQFLGSGGDGRVENSTRGLLSEAGLNYQFPRSSLEAQFSRQDRFDTLVSSKTFVGKVTLPRLSYRTVPIRFKKIPFYTSFNASYANLTQDRFDPDDTLRYQKVGTTGVQLKKDLRVKKWTVTPNLGYTETWQDRDLSLPDSDADIYQGRTNVGADFRRKISRSANLNLNHTYVIRSEKNQLGIDEFSDDRGIETNLFSTALVSRVGRNSRLTLASGYDFKQPPRSDPARYDHVSERITSPSADLQLDVTKQVSFYFREVYSLFDPSSRTVRRTPLNTSAEVQVAHPNNSFFFSHGFNYSKPASGVKPELFMNNKLRFYMTPKWYADIFLSYRAVSSAGVNYKKVFPIERTIRVVRDMHCWILRMEFSSRPDRNEASFYVDLKANMTSQKNVFAQSGYVPLIYQQTDMATIFPATDPNEHQK